MNKDKETKFLELFSKHVGYIRRDKTFADKMKRDILIGQCPFNNFECQNCVKAYNEDDEFHYTYCNNCWQDSNKYYSNSNRYNEMISLVCGDDDSDYWRRAERLVKAMLKIIDKHFGIKRRKK